MSEEKNAAPAPVAPAEPASLINTPALVEVKEPKITEPVSGTPSDPKPQYDFDKRLYTEDGKFNQDGAKQFFDDLKKKEEHYEKRILDLRRKVSDGKAPEKADEYFLDYAPPDKRFEKFFDPTAPSAEEIKNIQNLMSKQYFESGLTKRQGEDMTKLLLHVLESTNVIDTKTKEEKYVEKGKWIDEQKQKLGSNADNIIRETKVFIETSPVFTAKTKNLLLEWMESQGAEAIDAVYQIKEFAGGGNIPHSVSNVSGLPSDAELKREYLDSKTTDSRRQEITYLRAKAGRTGRLMDASF